MTYCIIEINNFINSFHTEYDLFLHLNNKISSYSNLGDILMMGDLNFRIGFDRETYVEDC